ncbi:hypothetical protein SERLA73DRAFT_163339 [Serpula lacrymans var. lacrymans S7.3]|uniref:Retrotransposon gag domain-containing protein n=1 Tax=Serpula lacrymans var. lacrymans (strain S7.3) TaxID=936435 RepID=F8QCX6_SERL3|nr:hypothetical protein SERLA73DRAFT_163339 [Serpula lacrymans var. lacrymans S7.3]
MSLQPQDVNALLHNMRQQILALTTQLAELWANCQATNTKLYNKIQSLVKSLLEGGESGGVRLAVSHWVVAMSFGYLLEGLQQISFVVSTIEPTPSVEKKFNKKVKVIADPGTFEGDRAQFTEWWIKLQIWVKANWDAFADNFEQICSFKQGNMRTDDFVTRFLALSIQGGLGNEHAVELLERNVNPHIAEQLYLQDMRSDDLSVAAEEVLYTCHTL